jgi:hypothetical protein
MTAMLTVMRDMDPHAISWNMEWVWFGWEFWIVMCCLCQSTTVDYVVWLMFRFRADEN